MSREAHEQFCESLGVQLSGATHLLCATTAWRGVRHLDGQLEAALLFDR